GMYQPCENIDCSSKRCQILQAFDAFIYIFFALEMVVKMVALGIFGQRCYLGDTWNRLDFFIVMAGVVEYSLDLQNINLTAIRTVRVLRPLKAINRVPSMRILVNLLLDTLPMLGNVLLLCFFVFFVFGIIGVQLWAGLLRNRCYPEENFTLSTGVALPAPYYSPSEEDERPFICSLPQDNGIMSCSDVPARRVAGHQCCLEVDDLLHHQALGLVTEPFLNASAIAPGLCVNWNRYYTRCHTGHRNPHKGAINFDNIGYAWIVIFQVITLEGWVEIMYYVMDAHSFYNFIYFILLIIVGSFFMINLCLVVIATQFSETKQREHQLMQEQRATCLSSSTLASLVEPSDCYEEIFQLVCHVLHKARRRTAAFFRMLCRKPPEQMHMKTNINGGEKRFQQHDGATPSASAANQETEEEAAEEKDRCMRAEGACRRRSRELWMEMRVKLQGIVESKYFNRGIMVAILINTISMGIEHHQQPEELTNVLEICNIVFTSMFALEMILKLTAFGFFNYLRNPYNIFDGIIVIISVCEIVGQSDGGLSVLRTFRLLRVLKLVRFMPALRRQLVVLMKTMDNVATFCMLLMLFIFIFSILGMHIFGCKFSLKTDTGDTVPDRKNFDSLLWAIVTVFQGDANRSYSDDDDDEGSSSNGSEQHKNSLTFSDPKLSSLTPNGHLDLAPLAEEKTRTDFSEENHRSRTICLGRRSSSLRHSRSSHYHHWGRPPPQPSWSRRCSWNSVGRSARGLRAGGVIGGSLRVRSVHSNPAEHESLLPHPPFLSRRHRRALSLELPELLQCPPLVRKKSVSAEHQDCNGKGPGPQGTLLGEVYPQLNARKDKHDLEEDTEYSLCFRIQKMMEVYRPDWCEKREDWSIYLFSPQNKFRLLCQTIIAHKLFDYVVLAFIFLSCITVALERPRIHQGSLERVFLTISNYVFTAIFVAEMTVKALMSLFVLASKDGWVNIMYHGLDAVGIDQQPVINNNPWMLLYFISFLLIVSFFVLNMFVGVVVENFHKCRQHQEVEEARRREEKRLKRMEKRRRKAQRLPYYSSYGRVRRMIHSFCTSHYLDLFITLIICINVVTMSLEHYNQPQSLETALKYCNYFFSSTFVVETMLKLVAFGFRRFLKDRWNQLDLAIVLLSVMGITLEEIEISASLPINPTIIRIMRVLRIARVLKLLKMATGMRALLDTVVQALPQVGNLGLLFVLLFFIYAALGVELFGELVCNVEYPCEGMSRHATFENFGMAFLTLFQVSTGDNWNGIMKDTLRECPPGDSYSCNSSLQIISPMYFVSFVLTAQFVLINVVVAVLMKHLDDSNKEAQEDAEMDAEIEMELAQGGLCCLGHPERSTGADAGERPSIHTNTNTSQSGFTQNQRRLYSSAQENQWLESVSLLMKDSLDGEMQMIDNLSGSVFHHYCSPAIRRVGRSQSGEIRLAEVEQTSLMSEQLSDKSSSPALPDDISLDEHSDRKEHGSADLSTGELVCRSVLPQSEACSPGRDRREERREMGHRGDGCGGDGQMSSPLFHLPAEFFHPTTAAVPQGSPAIGAAQPGSR
ncbi:voltage-dependent T-type calcium channel subunit alpha-1I-like, partial [Sinocyclocheilus anshuiensis]|uniref:voltage-dependent T-type calcium channel subunit alpha-1I-like n=1 Tax=Sinocyclocheilus anshuiensis TaxID=1608454 RepID=UPI0007BA8D62